MAPSREPLGPAELTALASAMRAAGIAEYTTPEGAVIKLGPPPATVPSRDEIDGDAFNLRRARAAEKLMYAAGTGCRIPPPR